MFLIILSETGIPLWVQVAAIVATLLFALATAFYAWRQHQLDKTNFKLATYDKRYEVYRAIKDFINGNYYDNMKLYEILPKYDQLTKGAKYLFDDKSIVNLVAEISAKGYELRGILEEKNMEEDIDMKRILMHKSSEIHKWFNNQNEIVDKLFEKYLNLGK